MTTNIPIASGYAPCAANPDLWHTKATRRECPRCVGAAVASVAPVVNAPKRRPGQDAEDGLARQLVIAGYVDLPAADARTSNDKVFVRQFAWGLYLSEPRRFASDFAFPSHRILVEIDGDAHAVKARRRGTVVRTQLAESAGWRVVTVLPEQVRDGTAIEVVHAALAAKEAKS